MYEKYIRPIRRFLGRQKRRLEAGLKALRDWFYRMLSKPLQLIPGGTDAGICYLNEKRPYTPELVIMSYCQGMFELGVEGNRLIWENPAKRAVIFMDDFYAPRNIRRDIRKKEGLFEVRFNTAFEEVMRNCANREPTWISEPIIQTWVELHKRGLAHSVETWQDGELVGGSYGLALGSYYAGESMFHKVDDASKVAFVALVDELKKAGITIIDVQYPSNLMDRVGAVEIPREEFNRHLAKAVTTPLKLVLPEVYVKDGESEAAEAAAG